MTDAIENVRKAVLEFVKSCGRNYEFPAGGENELLMPSEEKLYSALQTESLSEAEKVSVLRVGFDWSDCYSIVIFGVRLAVLAVRNTQPETYKLGVLALAAGIPKVDWRDVLGAFGIFENCGNRLGIRFQDEFKLVADITDVGSVQPTIDGFFSRDHEMRSIEVMGFTECGTGKEFTFRSK